MKITYAVAALIAATSAVHVRPHYKPETPQLAQAQTLSGGSMIETLKNVDSQETAAGHKKDNAPGNFLHTVEDTFNKVFDNGQTEESKSESSPKSALDDIVKNTKVDEIIDNLKNLAGGDSGSQASSEKTDSQPGQSVESVVETIGSKVGQAVDQILNVITEGDKSDSKASSESETEKSGENGAAGKLLEPVQGVMKLVKLETGGDDGNSGEETGSKSNGILNMLKPGIDSFVPEKNDSGAGLKTEESKSSEPENNDSGAGLKTDDGKSAGSETGGLPEELKTEIESSGSESNDSGAGLKTNDSVENSETENSVPAE